MIIARQRSLLKRKTEKSHFLQNFFWIFPENIGLSKLFKKNILRRIEKVEKILHDLTVTL
jgi:hypothetical protein